MYIREMFQLFSLKLALKVVGIHGGVVETELQEKKKCTERTVKGGLCARSRLGRITDPNDVDHNLGKYLTNKKICGSQSINWISSDGV